MRRVLGCVLVLAASLAMPAGVQAGKLAFTSSRCDDNSDPNSNGRDCGRAIWTARDDGTELRRLTGRDTPGNEMLDGYGYWDHWPSWSPDGETVYFKRTMGFQTLWAKPASGAPGRQVGPAAPNDHVPDYGEPAWSPDGKSVVFTSWTPGVTDAQRRDLYLLGADGTIRRLTHGPPYFHTPMFTRDGKRILAQNADNTGRIVSMDLQGGDMQPVFTSATSWSGAPGGRKFSHLEYGLSPDGRTLVLNSDGVVYTTQLEGGILSQRTKFLGLGTFQAGRLAYADEPGPRLITSSEYSFQHPLGSLDLVTAVRQVILPCPCLEQAGAPDGIGLPRGMSSEYDSEPAWAPSTPRPQVDVTPPALELSIPAVSPARTGRARATYPAVRRGSLRLQTFDTSGVRGIEASVSRQVRTKRGVRCKFLEQRGFGRIRRCGRPRYRAIASGVALNAGMRAFPGGRYRLDVRARDAHSRRSRARTVRFTLAAKKPAAKKR